MFSKRVLSLGLVLLITIGLGLHGAAAKDAGKPTRTSSSPTPTPTCSPYPTETWPSDNFTASSAPAPSPTDPVSSSSSVPSPTDWPSPSATDYCPPPAPTPGPTDLSVSASTYNYGQTSIYVSVWDQGSNVARNVHVTGRLPNVGTPWMMEYGGYTGCIHGLRVDCTIPLVYPGSGDGFSFTTTITCKALSARFTIRSADDSTNRNNVASVSTPDLCKTGTDASVHINGWQGEGGRGFHVSVQNPGTNDARDVQLMGSFSGGGWTFRDAANGCSLTDTTDAYYNDSYTYSDLECALGTVASGSEFAFDVVAPTVPCNQHQLYASGQLYASNDYDSSNNFGWDELYLPLCPGGADVQVFSGEYRRSTHDVGFEVTLTNAGPDAANDTSLRVSIPYGDGTWTLAASDGVDCPPDGSGYQCAVGHLEAGATRTFTLTSGDATCEDYYLDAHATASNDWIDDNNYGGGYVRSC